MLQTFADQAVIAIENARLLAELRTKNSDLTESLDQQTATSEILRVISQSPTDVQPVFDAIARNARRLCDTSSASVLMLDGTMIHLAAIDNEDAERAEAFRRAYPRPVTNRQAGGRAVRTGRTVHIPDVLELRTPLNAIIGFSEVLNERMFGELNEKQDEYLKDIHASGTHLQSLINDILDLSKIEAGRMELELTDFSLPAAIESSLTLVRERATRRGIALGLDVDAGVGEVRADERKVRQVLLNLLSNAIKFTSERGRIEVKAAPENGAVDVSVSDTGIGIAPEDQEAVFEEFRQVGSSAAKQQGTGLGLTLCQKFVELHGGRIWVTSALGAGSTFTFRLPIRQG